MSAGRAFRDGVFSTAEPRAGFAAHSQTAYADGSLGQVGREFRDGLFSQAAPQARYQQLTQQYQDGSLGLTRNEGESDADFLKRSHRADDLKLAGAIAAAVGIAYIVYRSMRRR